MWLGVGLLGVEESETRACTSHQLSRALPKLGGGGGGEGEGGGWMLVSSNPHHALRYRCH